MQLSPASYYFLPCQSKYPLQNSVLRHSRLLLFQCKEQVSHPYKINTLKISLKCTKGWSPLVTCLYPAQQKTSSTWKVIGETTQHMNIWPTNVNNRFCLYSQKRVSCSVRGPDHIEGDQTPSSTCDFMKSQSILPTLEHALSCNITTPSVSMLGSFLLMAVALSSQKGFTTPPHVTGDVMALEC